MNASKPRRVLIGFRVRHLFAKVNGQFRGFEGTVDFDQKNGVSREVMLDADFLGAGKDPRGNQRYGFHAETKINRKDFGMAWNEVIEAGGRLVGDEVEIVRDVEAVAAK